MKEKIVYGLIFILLFAIVSAGMIYFNSKYKNIFAFDFSPRINEEQFKNDLAKDDSLKADTSKANSLKLDSTKIVTDSSKINNVNKNVVAETSSQLKNVSQIKEVNIASSDVPFRLPTNDKTKAKKDSIYNEWVKQTVKLYESMDSKKAAKVIVNYSDNIARDILLKMKKKKAAEILAELKPEVVSRIISVN